MKIHPVEAEPSYFMQRQADGRTDMIKLMVIFFNITKAPKSKKW
jgi:hypothetical protein